jgi:exportin-1
MQVDGLTEPLWDVATVQVQYQSNAMFVREYTINLLGASFPNMTVVEVQFSQCSYPVLEFL